ncbi:hypothetical protein [Aquiflexum sp.]|uniref:hypothetical protein n=1 Tax=Aquiflexum sp. TaxID=1872584 RepID=UPI003593B889
MVSREGWEFLSRIQLDRRAFPSHISIVAAIIQSIPIAYPKNSSYKISRKKIMKMAHIKGIATYHNCINNLVEWGYIKYEPSYHPSGQTRVWIVREFGKGESLL